ncbi:hypothetical protein [Nocardioides jejuensis]|nr:hypothetical protein [Nocardioides jejuensis]
MIPLTEEFQNPDAGGVPERLEELGLSLIERYSHHFSSLAT